MVSFPGGRLLRTFKLKMKLVSKKCKICQEPIFFQIDGTWCAACSSVFHDSCIKKNDNLCPKCKNEREKPEDHFKIAKYCPSCFSTNQSQALKCSKCKTPTYYENTEEYEKQETLIRKKGKRKRVIGYFEIGIGLVWAAIFIKISILGWYFQIIPFILISDGLHTISRAKKMINFE